MTVFPSYDPNRPHREQLKAAEEFFLGSRVKLRRGAVVDGGAAFEVAKRSLKRTTTVKVTAVSFGREGLFLAFGHGERNWWAKAEDVVDGGVKRRSAPTRRLRLSGLAMRAASSAAG